MPDVTQYYSRNFRVSGPFGEDREGSPHQGADFSSGREGDPILTINPGKVQISGYSSSAGNWVVVKQDDGALVRYLHMQSLSNMKVGERVERGVTIGRVGNTGKSTGPHLHIDVEYNGEKLDPLKYMEHGLEGPKLEDPGTMEGRQKETTRFFLNKGYSPQAVQAILGNIMSESNFRFDITKDDKIENSFGLAQWNEKGAPGRYKMFKEAFGKDLRQASFHEQLEFIDYEIKNNYTYERTDLLGRLNSPEITGEEATEIFAREYENPAIEHRTGKGLQMRVDHGQKIFNTYSSYTPTPEEAEGAIAWNYGKSNGPEPARSNQEALTDEYGQKYFIDENGDRQNLFSKEGMENQSESLTSLGNQENKAIFAELEYRKEKDREREKLEAEKAEEKAREGRATAAENKLREETQKRKFLMNYALKTLDYETPEYHRVGKQPQNT